ncbi:MAG: chemotaxis protein CheX [Bryobacteraceae bacterium]|nr:chemotaxis protein CheX [Bryobacteraceae bacterium]
MQQEKLVEMIRTATHEVFGTMLGIELTDGEASVGQSAPEPIDGVVAIVGLAGRWVGTGTFSASAEGARKIAGTMLMQEYAAVDDEVLDAVGEVTNMIIGNVKTTIEEEYGPMGLSIPTVIYGRNFTTRSVGRNEWVVVPFTCMDTKVEVHLCLIPGSENQSTGRQTAILTMQ